jgi:hypothetical protein
MSRLCNTALQHFSFVVLLNLRGHNDTSDSNTFLNFVCTWPYKKITHLKQSFFFLSRLRPGQLDARSGRHVRWRGCFHRTPRAVAERQPLELQLEGDGAAKPAVADAFRGAARSLHVSGGGCRAQKESQRDATYAEGGGPGSTASGQQQHLNFCRNIN